MIRSLILVGVALLPLAAPGICRANGDPIPTAAPPAATHFERFVRSACSPCIQEAFPVKAVSVQPVQLPANALGLRFGTEMPPRPGQIAFAVMRAAELNRPTKMLMAVRITLSAGMGTNVVQLFPLGTGMLDAEDAADLGYGINAVAKAVATPVLTGTDNVDVDYRTGSVRVGLVRAGDEGVAYIQVGDIALQATKPVWQVPTTIFFAPSELPALAGAMSEILAKLKALRN